MSSPDRSRSITTRVRTLPLLPATVAAVGALVALVALGRAGVALHSGGSTPVALVDTVFVGGAGLAVLYAGFWMSRSQIDADAYPRLIAWPLGGVAVMYGFIILRDLHPGVSVAWSPGTQAIALTIGSIGGLLIGVQEVRASVRANQLEQRTAELAARTRALERREEELERQNEQLDEFVGIVSHDLRNPLNVARGRLELVAEHCDSEHVAHVDDAHERMEVLIEDLLVLARQEEDAASPEPLALADLATACWESVEATDATLTVATDAVVVADRSRLRQLLENLFRNSVEHGSTSPDSQARRDSVEHGSTSSRAEPDAAVAVTVGTLDDGGFYVADEGPGIPESEREAVFESGYSTAEDGTGFGLAIVAEVADAHGWSVTVTEGDAGGARFEFRDVETD